MKPDPTRAALLRAHGLPQRWRGRARFVIVEGGFGRGENFCAAWQAWKADPSACGCLAYWALLEAHEARALAANRSWAFDSTESSADAEDLGEALSDVLPGLQARHFENGRVRLYLAVGPLASIARERVGLADAFSLTDAPLGHGHGAIVSTIAALTRRRQPDATVAIGALAFPALREAVSAAGFEWSVPTRGEAEGTCSVVAGRARPTRQPAALDHRWIPSAGRQPEGQKLPLSGQRIGVIGAGLAGCATAGALARLGAQVHLLDRHDRPAAETSGNPAGLVHSVFHDPPTPHARLLRAAAVDAARDARVPTASPGDGLRAGLLRIESQKTTPEMRASLDACGLPASHLCALAEGDVPSACGLTGPNVQGRPAWLHGDGGWVDPRARCNTWVTPGSADPAGSAWEGAVHWRGHFEVERLVQASDGWTVIGLDSRSAQTLQFSFDGLVVAASGAQTQRLTAAHGDSASWPLEPVRGQLRLLPAATPGLQRPSLAVTSGSYALTLDDGRVIVGATSQPGDTDPNVRVEDATRLLADARAWGVLPALTAGNGPEPAADSTGLEGAEHRAGVRWRTPDRLPIVGPVAQATAGGAAPPGAREDQPRFVPRVPGLYVFTALGSRGISWAHWGAELLAASMSGLPAPVESSLLDRIDPARFRVMKARRRSIDP